MFGMGAQELLFLAVIIVVLSVTGLWPQVIRGLRELRGERFPDEPGASRSEVEVYCRLLGISPSSSLDEIERAYRKKAKIHHPDLGGDEDAMRALNDAYAQLKKLKSRRG